MKKFFISFLIYFAAFFASTNVANALTGTCAEDAEGSIVISDTAGGLNGKAGTQVQEQNGNQKAPFKYANNFIDPEFSDNDTDACQTQPLFYKIKFYKVALCLTDPYTENADPDYSSCSDIFNNDDGKEIIIEPDAEVDLLEGDLFIPSGVYKFLTVVTSNHIHIKHIQKYVYGNGDRAVMYGAGDNGTNTTTDTCYTEAVVTTYTGQTYDNDYSVAQGGVTVVDSNGTHQKARMECVSGNPAADYNYATEIIDHFGDDATLVPNIAYESMLANTGVAVELAGTMLKDNNTSVADDVDNAVRIGLHFSYTNPVVISSQTVGFKLNFATTRGVSLDAGQDGNNKIFMVKVGADPFTIEVQTKTKRVRGDWR